MNRFLKASLRDKTLGILAILMLAVAFSACDDRNDPYYDDPYGGPGAFVGSWELVSINSTPIYPDEYTTYDLWGNGSGNYGFYAYGQWYNQPLSWSLSMAPDGYTMLYINSSQGYFTYEVSYLGPGTMILLDIDTQNQLEYQRY